jgi:hypothetical protein
MPTLPKPRRRLSLRLGLLAALVTATALVPAGAASADQAGIMARPNFKSPFDCNQTFYANNWSPGHSPANSIDWQAYNGVSTNGKNVRATAGGTARFYDRGATSYGKYVIVTHADGWSTLYAHLSSMVRSAGQSMSVSLGTKIGVSGATGGVSGPHLHYEQKLNGANQTPIVEGVTVPLGSKKAIKSSNGCGGSSNPYTPGEVCGSGYAQINSHALGSVGRIYLMYNASNGNNCVVTLKDVSLGTPSAVSASLEVQGGTKTTDSGSFSYYAGPVRKSAASTCVKWGGSVGSTSWVSAWSHCG